MTLLQEAIELLDRAHAVEATAHHFLRWGQPAFDARLAMAGELRCESRAMAAAHHTQAGGSMSIDRCSKCSALVDTDNEPEAYVQIADMRKREEWICLCRRHREEREDQRAEPTKTELEAIGGGGLK